MITASPEAFLDAFATLEPTAPASARAAFLVAPAAFSLAEQSASDNVYMDLSDAPDPTRAMRQHAALAEALREDLPVVVFPGDTEAPDGVFPNNVFATAPGRLVVGRMHHPVRQQEAGREDIRGFFGDVLGYEEVDFSGCDDLVTELTGSIIIDRARKVGFCGLGQRCDAAGAEAMHKAFGLELTFCFELGASEYHTNVVMALLASRAVILASDGFADARVPETIARAYGGRTLWLDKAQKKAFAGNAITLCDDRVWMSARGAASLTDEQRAMLSAQGFRIGSVDLDEIEKAGGSLRCCVAEIY